MTDTWTFQLPIEKPMSMNDRLHWAEKGRQTKEIRDAVHMLCRSKRVPKCQKISVHLVWFPGPLIRRRDPLNLVATLKAVEDGVVQAGVVPDDTPEFVTSVMPRIGVSPVPKGQIYVTIERLA